MKITAAWIEQLEGWRGNAALYKLSEPVKFGDGYDNKTEFVAVSAVSVPYSGAETYIFPTDETYIFPTDEKGNVLDWGELPGSIKGCKCHETAIRNAGWSLAE